MIRTTALCKSYKGIKAVNGLNMHIGAGEILWIHRTERRRQEHHLQNAIHHRPSGQRYGDHR